MNTAGCFNGTLRALNIGIHCHIYWLFSVSKELVTVISVSWFADYKRHFLLHSSKSDDILHSQFLGE